MSGDRMDGGIVPASASAMGGMIHVVRGQQVMLDSDLAALYGVETREQRLRSPQSVATCVWKEPLLAMRAGACRDGSTRVLESAACRQK